MKIMKKLFALLAAGVLCAALSLPCFAAAPLILDEAGVFDADTYTALEENAAIASDGHDCDVYFLVVDSIGDENQRDYAKNYYITNDLGSGEGKSGILFLLAVGSRKYVTITYGNGVTIFTDYRIGQMEDAIVSDLSNEDWTSAAWTYLEMADETLNFYEEYGEPIDSDNYTEPLGAEGLIFVIGIPVIIAAIVCSIPRPTITCPASSSGCSGMSTPTPPRPVSMTRPSRRALLPAAAPAWTAMASAAPPAARSDEERKTFRPAKASPLWERCHR